jgi:hypothetical protein
MRFPVSSSCKVCSRSCPLSLKCRSPLNFTSCVFMISLPMDMMCGQCRDELGDLLGDSCVQTAAPASRVTLRAPLKEISCSREELLPAGIIGSGTGVRADVSYYCFNSSQAQSLGSSISGRICPKIGPQFTLDLQTVPLQPDDHVVLGKEAANVCTDIQCGYATARAVRFDHHLCLRLLPGRN